MKRNKKWQEAAAMFLLALGLVTAAPGGASAEPLASPEDNVLGMSYGDWSAAWWQYILAVPTPDNPSTDATGCGPDLQTTGPVYFLAGNFTGQQSVTRNCTIPAGRTLVLPIINTECSNLEAPPFFGSNEKDLRSCAAGFMDTVDLQGLKLTIDGVPIQHLRKFRAQSPVFAFYLPQDNILGVTGLPAEGARGLAVSDGYWAVIPPLTTPGTHTIHFEGSIPDFSINVTYNLTVAK